MNVSSSLLYVWLTDLCLRMYQMMVSVAVMKMIFIRVLYLCRRRGRARSKWGVSCTVHAVTGAAAAGRGLHAHRDEGEEQVEVSADKHHGVQLLCAQRDAWQCTRVGTLSARDNRGEPTEWRTTLAAAGSGLCARARNRRATVSTPSKLVGSQPH